MRTCVYVDGFNLYYGALKDSPWKWLDLQAFFESLLNQQDVRRIKYFTSVVSDQNPRNPHARERQQAYLDAVKTLPKVEIITGRLRNGKEKMTDVAIAVHMLDDAYRQEFDQLALVSGDADFLPALAMIKKRFRNKDIVVYVPDNDKDAIGSFYAMKDIVDHIRFLPTQGLKHSMLPNPVRSGQRDIAKPEAWGRVRIK